jgi:tRNA 2-thiouridine synthesizing protein A
MKTIDARGLSCPQPVIMLKKAMSSRDDEYECIVDSKVCVENCTRFASHEGYGVEVEETPDTYILKIKK